jgi:hypothetical protein
MAARCSVWFSALKRKAIVKQVRSFQRTVCLLLTRAFKTTYCYSVTPDSGELDANCALRRRSSCSSALNSGLFSNILIWCYTGVQVIKFRDQANGTFSLLVPTPWQFNFRRKLLPRNLVVSPLPCGMDTLHILVACIQLSGELPSFCFAVVASNCNGILHIERGDTSKSLF